MIHHFSYSELPCPAIGEVQLAISFGEVLERLRFKLDVPIYLTGACQSPG